MCVAAAPNAESFIRAIGQRSPVLGSILYRTGGTAGILGRPAFRVPLVPASAPHPTDPNPMPGLAVLAFVIVAAAPSDTGKVAREDSATGPTVAALAVGVRAEGDTVRPRRRSVEVSEWYERRLRIHRYGAYSMIPLFAVQAIAGNQVYQDPKTAPDWAKTTHRVGAAGLATVFTLNTVTGLWNLWESRGVEQGRTRRTVHSLLMLASDAGFTYAGVKLSEDAETSIDKRELHRKFAYGSMATALTGAGLMTIWREK